MEENKLHIFFREKFNLSEDTIHSIADNFKPEFYPKNTDIVNVGEKCNKLYFIEEGLIRTYHITDNGTEFTRLIACENKFVTILNSFQDNEPSEATLTTLEDTALLSVDAKTFYDRIKIDNKCKEVYQVCLEEYQKFQLQRIELLTRYSPIERIKIFRKENKDLIPRLTNKIIASYLNMTPETYSRSLKKLLE